MDTSLRIIAIFLLLATAAKAQLIAVSNSPPVPGGIRFVNASAATVDNTGAGTTSVINYNASAGDTILIGCQFNTSVSSLSAVDNLSTNYPVVGLAATTNGGTGVTKEIWLFGLNNIPSGVTSFTVSWGVAGPKSICVAVEYGGVTAFGQFIPAGNASATSGTIGTASASSSAFFTQYANNYMVGFFEVVANVTPATTAGTFRFGSGGGGTWFGGTAAFVDNTAASAGSALSTGISWAGSQPWGGVALELSTGKVNIYQYFTAGVCTSPCTASTSYNSGTTGPTLLANSIAGDYIFALAQDIGTTSQNVTFSDSGSNTYNAIKPGGTNAFCNLSIGTTRTMAMSYAKVGATGFLGIGAAGHAGDLMEVTGVEVNGLASSTPLDQTSTCTDTNSVTALTTSSITTTNATDLLFALFGANTSLNWTTGTGYMFTGGVPLSSDAHVFSESKYVIATGSYTASSCATACTSGEQAGFLTAFKAAP